MPVPVLSPALTKAEGPEQIVIAARSVVGEDQRQRVGAHGPARRDIESAAHTLPVAAPETRRPADGVVAFDRGVCERERRESVLEDPASLTISAFVASAPGATDDA